MREWGLRVRGPGRPRAFVLWGPRDGTAAPARSAPTQPGPRPHPAQPRAARAGSHNQAKSGFERNQLGEDYGEGEGASTAPQEARGRAEVRWEGGRVDKKRACMKMKQIKRTRQQPHPVWAQLPGGGGGG